MDQKIETVQLVADAYPPYQYMEGRTVRGVDHDIIAAAFAEHGIDTITRLLPWDDCIQLLTAGKAHGIFQIVRTPEREKAFIFSKPLRTERTLFHKRAEDSINLVKDLDFSKQLKKYRVGVVKGYSYDPLIDSLGEAMRTEVNSQEALLTSLSRGDCDLALIDWGIAEYLAKRIGIKGIDKVEGYETSRQLHVAFHQDRDEIAVRFNSGVDRVKAKGLWQGP